MADVIVALDVPSTREALALVDRLGPAGTFYKVGLELYTREGPGVVEALRTRDKRVFLDLKLLDIPTTVAGAVRSAAALDVELLTVHATGGHAMMEAGREAAGSKMRLLAVTLLTSLEPTDVERIWGRELLSLRDEVLRLAGQAKDAGINGVVSSAHEARALRRHLGPDAYLVTPGIRLPGGDTHDQARVMTPAQAVDAGADALVVGRAVTAADDPAEALAWVLDHAGAAA